MKPRLTDYLIIGISMFITLGAGIGIGFLWRPQLPKSAKDQGASALVIDQDTTDWEVRLLQRLTMQLELNPEQYGAIASELEETRKRIDHERDLALEGYRRELMAFFTKVETMVDQNHRHLVAAEAETFQNRLRAKNRNLINQ